MDLRMVKPLYQMNPLGRFSDCAQDYLRYRPSYPSEVINYILQGLENSSSIIADIGAGTGIASRLLADRRVKVLAIEPNESMRQVAISHPLVEFRDGKAESTGLPNNSVDLVTCFQAFHWFDPEPTLIEFTRILKTSGKIALIWNDRDLEGDDEFTRQHGCIIAQAADGNPIHTRLNGDSYQLIHSWFPNVSHHQFSHQQSLNLKGLIGLAMSASYLPREGEKYEQLMQNLETLYERYCDERGLVYLHYKTGVYLTEIINK